MVKGTLLIDGPANSLIFVATGGHSGGVAGSAFGSFGTLPGGSYTLRIRSTANSIRDTLGGLLDGDANGTVTAGDDYVLTYVQPDVLTSSVVIGIADFARGPGQSVQVPAIGGTGLPVTVSIGAGVKQVQFALDFDSTLLTISDFVLNPALTNVTRTFSTPSAGRVEVTVTATVELTTAHRHPATRHVHGHGPGDRHLSRTSSG